MDLNALRRLFEQVERGELSARTALERLSAEAIDDLGFAKIDVQRRHRCGFPEVIYSEGKSPEQTLAIFERLAAAGHGALATRVNAEQAALILERFPNAEHDPIGRTIWDGALPQPIMGVVAVITAGTSDLPVAKEAQTTARVMGCQVELVVDVGVAGLHRLLRHYDTFRGADAIVVVAGMEGALPSVVGGLVDCPVIAVPTSIGYGASFNGVAALLGMLSSCAANVTVVNIDAGFCGGYVAGLIARRAAAGRQS
jgi:hypothetical protein